ncbi:MAG: Macrolide export protein MacA [Thermoanaerobaculia bacterium]|nr:Macrolide export protein MacA [Thermoanaerobaculia bacterium]
MMKKILSFALVTLVLALFAGTVYFLWAKSRRPKTVYETESPKVATIIKKAVSTGSVVPRKEVAIKPRVSGIVEEVLVEAGQKVKEGDLIARIRLVPDMVNLNNAQSRVAKAEIGLAAAEKDFKRNQPLARDGTISAGAFLPFETAFSNARAELEAAKANLDLIEKGISRVSGSSSNTLVRSTITGTILEVPVKAGNSVIETNTFNEGTTIATVADMDDMVFLGRVDESEVGKLKQGMKLLLTIGAVEGKKPEATLEHIAPKGVEKDGAIQFEIRAALPPQKDVTIRANYSANADIVLDKRDEVLAINESLLRFEGGKRFVEVETAPQVFEKRPVETGLSDGIQVEVLSGLTAKDRLKKDAARPATSG